MARAEHWQVQGREAELYEQHLVPAVTALWAADLVERAGVRRGDRVLDVACGTGVVARAAAERVGREGSVTGLDINPAMLEVAGSKSPGVEFVRGSALSLPFDDGAFEIVLCQLGLQFFPNRAAALAQMRRVLHDGGQLGLSVYGPIEDNPGTLALAQALDHHLGTGASQTKRAEHILSYASLVERLVTAAGFQDVAITTETKLVRFPSTEEWVQIQLTATPLASLLAEQLARPRVTERITASVKEALGRYETDGALEFPQEAHVVTAHV
ncbi:MAG TPA: methyltransferase domain-containing protein [Solirubrobacteraceae bacterium]|nr:methyltransferase domain-containing protein [Solirubrobacteraceae bacterium]